MLMQTKSTSETAQKPTLGQYLGSIRNDRGFTLRKVEEATNKEVSNAYLSQIENDKIEKPSPHILHALAELYGIDTLKLLEMAGYIAASTLRGSDERHSRVATFAEHNLTPEEEATLLEYLRFIRSRKRSDDKAG
jgi:transcriptional regulator with XRE-family HTH domain